MAQIPFTDVLLTYFVISAVMFGAGGIDMADADPLNLVFTEESLESNNPDVDEKKFTDQFDFAFAILGPFSAILAAMVKFILSVLALIHWPIITLIEHGAPTRVWVLLGGSLTAMFYVSAFAFVRGLG